MKKIFAAALVAVLCLVLCSCGQKGESERPSPAVQQTEATPTPTPTPAQEPIPAPEMEEGFEPVMPAAEEAAAAQQTASAGTEASTAAPAPAVEVPQAPAPVYATKSPTSECVIQGGSAQFVAYAQNSTAVKWFLASPDCGFCVTAAEAPGYFPGLTVSGSASTRLTLSNIPLALNGWKVQARFEGFGGPVHTDMATVWCITMEEAIARGLAAPPAYSQVPYPPAYTYPPTTAYPSGSVYASGYGYAYSYFCPPVFR